MANINEDEFFEFRRRVAKDRRIWIPKEFPEIEVGDLLIIRIRKVNYKNKNN